MAKILTLFGFIWLLAGNVIGLVLARRHEERLADVEALRSSSSAERLTELYQRDWAYRWNKTCHAHVSLFSIVCVLVGLSLQVFGIPASVLTRGIAIALIAAVVLWTVFSFRMVKPAMAVADVLFVASVAATAWVLATGTLGVGS